MAIVVSTAPEIAGRKVVQTLGTTYGVVVRSQGIGGNLLAALRGLAGGEIHEYTRLLEDTRRQAVDRLIENAQLLGADAIIAMRFDSSEIGQTMTEVVAYGTAVKLEA